MLAVVTLPVRQMPLITMVLVLLAVTQVKHVVATSGQPEMANVRAPLKRPVIQGSFLG
jgi:hypothetical protein